MERVTDENRDNITEIQIGENCTIDSLDINMEDAV
ncbi:hypothetical protein SDC9_120976 [bioreactor metagenome]